MERTPPTDHCDSPVTPDSLSKKGEARVLFERTLKARDDEVKRAKQRHAATSARDRRRVAVPVSLVGVTSRSNNGKALSGMRIVIVLTKCASGSAPTRSDYSCETT